MRIHWRAFVVLAAGSLPWASFSPPASAQEAPAAADDAATEAPAAAEDEAATERARELFSEGIGFVEEEQWEPAAERFRAALALKDAPAVRYNLALSLNELGQASEARELVEGVLADPETPPDVRAQAEALASEIPEAEGEPAADAAAPSPADVAAAAQPSPEGPVAEPGGGDSLFTDWRLWAVVGGAAILIGVVAVIVATSGGVEDPVEGNFDPGVLRW